MGAVGSHGTIVAVQLTPGGSWTNIGQLGDIVLPSFERTEIDASVQSDSLDSYVISGLIRRQAMTFPINVDFSDGTHDNTTGIYKLFAGNVLTGYKVTFPDSIPTVWVFSGQITKTPQITAKVDGKLEGTVTIRPVTGMLWNGASYPS